MTDSQGVIEQDVDQRSGLFRAKRLEEQYGFHLLLRLAQCCPKSTLRSISVDP
ncbi:hypothetical protein GCM10010402_52980 [Actinomadura luteofluorescens]